MAAQQVGLTKGMGKTLHVVILDCFLFCSSKLLLSDLSSMTDYSLFSSIPLPLETRVTGAIEAV